MSAHLFFTEREPPADVEFMRNKKMSNFYGFIARWNVILTKLQNIILFLWLLVSFHACKIYKLNARSLCSKLCSCSVKTDKKRTCWKTQKRDAIGQIINFARMRKYLVERSDFFSRNLALKIIANRFNLSQKYTKSATTWLQGDATLKVNSPRHTRTRPKT